MSFPKHAAGPPTLAREAEPQAALGVVPHARSQAEEIKDKIVFARDFSSKIARLETQNCAQCFKCTTVDGNKRPAREEVKLARRWQRQKKSSAREALHGLLAVGMDKSDQDLRE